MKHNNLERHQAQLFTLAKNGLLALLPIQRVFPLIFVLRPLVQCFDFVLREFHHVDLSRIDKSFEGSLES